MSVTMIAIAKINPEQKFAAQKYSESAMALMKSYGGSLLNRFMTAKSIVGNSAPQLTLLVEFEDEHKLTACFASEEYEALCGLRDKGFADMQIYMAN